MTKRKQYSSSFKGARSAGGDPGRRHDSGAIEPLWDSPEHDLEMEAAGGGRGQGELCFRALKTGGSGHGDPDATGEDRRVWWWSGIFYPGPSIDESRSKARDGGSSLLAAERVSPERSVGRQPRERVLHPPRGVGFNLRLMRVMDEQYLSAPWYGSRQMARALRRMGYGVGRKRVRRLMRVMGLQSWRRVRTPPGGAPAHPVYPYLLRELSMDRPDQVWCADVTYIPMARGFLYLVAVMDWHSRCVLTWQLSTTQGRRLLPGRPARRPGPPQPAGDLQHRPVAASSPAGDWIEALKAAGIRISMDGKGRWLDNVFIERLWRSLKQECVYLNAFDSMRDASAQIGRWIAYYNRERPHSSLGGRTPFETYAQPLLKQAA